MANDANQDEGFVLEKKEEALIEEKNASVDAFAADPMDRSPSSCSSSSSSSSESESDSDEDGAKKLQIEALERALAENPFNYEAHVQYIQHLRKLGLIEKLRDARESMNECFPLTPQMWQEWARDEISLSSSAEDLTKIEKLYERGLHEYLSVPLWCAYINFVQEHDQSVCQCSPAGISKMRNLFERAITAAGLHVVEGNKIWEAYREYEQAICLTISENNNEEKVKQANRIRALFHRQLSIPLVGLKSTLAAYKLWEGEHGNVKEVGVGELDGVPSNVASSYQKAMEMYNARVLYEDQLCKRDASDTEKLQHFMNYIKFEESSGDPARVQILYERAVSELQVLSDLWVAYTSYLDKTLKVPNILKNVYSRATRNCSWVGDLWVRYMLSLERIHASEEELSTVFEKSIQCSFPSFKEYMDLFLTRVDGLRRRISMVGEKEDCLHYALIRDTFQRAVDYLSPQLMGTNDLLHLHAYWARLEANIGNDLVTARGVWESLIKKSGSILEVWQSYIAMETEMGYISEARSIYKRCYSKRFPGTGSEDICYSWLRFEREYGTLDDYDLAVRKVTPRLQELMMFRTQQEQKTSILLSAQNDTSVVKDTSHKRKMTSMSDDKQSSVKKQKGSTVKPTKVAYGDHIKRSGDSQDVRIKDKAEGDASVADPNAHTTDEKAVEASKSKETKPKVYKDQCTAFISNLNFKANEEHLRDFFRDCGVTAIRMLRDKFTGQSRGLAYVDFSDEEHLRAAIAKNKHRLLGQKLSIARSDPTRGKKWKTSAGSSPRERGDEEHPSKIDVSGKADAPQRTAEERHDSNAKPRTSSNTFAAPRSVVKPLGWTNRKPTTEEISEQPKSNDQFREMLLKNTSLSLFSMTSANVRSRMNSSLSSQNSDLHILIHVAES